MRKLLRRVARFRALNAAQQWTVFVAAALLPLCWFALRVFGIAPVFGWAQRSAQKSTRPFQSIDDIQAIGWAVNLTARRSLFPASCLTRSLVLVWILRRRGAPCSLRIGVKLDSRQLNAHAWVECDGVPVNDRRDIGLEFASFGNAVPVAAFDNA